MGMNDRLDLSRLAAATASFPPYFEALADETTWSYLTRAMLLAGFNDSRRMLTEALFSKPRLLISQPFHPGLGRFADHLRLSGGLDEVVRRHAMLQFYAPFVGVELFECVKEKLGGERASGVDCQLCSDLANTFRSTPAFCPACYDDDLTRLPGVSYYRRSHQVRAVTHCAVHGEALIERCSVCGAGFSHWHLPAAHCRQCGAPLVAADGVQGEARVLRIRVARIVAATFAGVLPSVSVPQRLAAIRDRVAQRVRNRSGVVGDNLARYLVRGFGADYLKALRLDPREKPAFGWPMLMIHGRWMHRDPVANCIVLAAIFYSPADYGASVRAADSLPEARLPLPYQISGGEGVTSEILRCSFKSSLESLVRQPGVMNRVKLWFAAYPGLRKRREAHAARSGLNLSDPWSIRRAQLGYLESRLLDWKSRLLKRKGINPGVGRSDLDNLEHTAFRYLQRKDPAWLDREFPRKPKGGRKRLEASALKGKT